MGSNADLVTIRTHLAAALMAVDQLLNADQARPLGDSEHVQALPRTKAIEWVLERRSEPMRPVEIWAELRRFGREDPKMEIQVTTYDLWERRRIGKVGRGLYVADPTATPDG